MRITDNWVVKCRVSCHYETPVGQILRQQLGRPRSLTVSTGLRSAFYIMRRHAYAPSSTGTRMSLSVKTEQHCLVELGRYRLSEIDTISTFLLPILKLATDYRV